MYRSVVALPLLLLPSQFVLVSSPGLHKCVPVLNYE
jgi:hypothetical protein